MKMEKDNESWRAVNFQEMLDELQQDFIPEMEILESPRSVKSDITGTLSEHSFQTEESLLSTEDTLPRDPDETLSKSYSDVTREAGHSDPTGDTQHFDDVYKSVGSALEGEESFSTSSGIESSDDANAYGNLYEEASKDNFQTESEMFSTQESRHSYKAYMDDPMDDDKFEV